MVLCVGLAANTAQGQAGPSASGSTTDTPAASAVPKDGGTPGDTAPAGTPAAKPRLPDGYGEARFGMSRAQVMGFFPGARVVQDTAAEIEKSGASTSLPPLAVVEVDGGEVLGMKGCKVGLRFAADQLYFITFDCGSDPAVRATLEKAYGNVGEEVGNGLYWHEGPRSVSMNAKSMQFAFIDRTMDQKVQNTIAKALVDQKTREAAAAAGSKPE